MHKFVRLKQLLKSLQTPRGRFFTVAAFLIVSFVFFILLYHSFGLTITTLGLIPVLMVAWFYGMWAGVLFTLALYVVNVWVLIFLRWENFQIAILPSELLGLATGVIASLIVGWLGESGRKNQEKIRQRTALLEQRNTRARFLKLLNDILLTTLETSDTSSMLQVLAKRIGELFNTDNCYITFWDDENRKTIPMAAYGPLGDKFFSALNHLNPDERTLTAAVMEAGHAIAIEDTTLPSYPIPINIPEKYSCRSLLGLPLISGDRKLGAAVLVFSDLNHFTKEEIEHGEMAARQISLAVIKAMLLEEARKNVHELTGLHDISQAFSLHGDARRTFGLLVEIVAGLMGAKICLVSLYNAATNELHAQSPAYGVDAELVSTLHYPSETGKTAWDFSRYGSFRANSGTEIPKEFTAMARIFGVECVMATPLWDTEKHLVGVIFVANKPGGFSENDVHSLEVFADQVTIVIQNAHLLHTERSLAEKLAVLYSIAVATTEADNEDQLIEHVTLIIG